MSKIAVVNRSAPYGNANGQESLDLVLAAGSFGQEIGVFFVDDGVFQLLSGQQPEQIDIKNYSKTFAALEFYDVEDIFVCADSLSSRSLSQSDLCIDAQVLSKDELDAKLRTYYHLLSF